MRDFIRRINHGIYDLFYIWKHELVMAVKDTGMLIFFIIVPLVYPILYGLIYNTEVLHDVPVAVVDNSRTALSREYLRKVDATSDVSIFSYCANMEEAKELMARKQVYGIIEVPNSFSDDIVEGIQTHVSVFCNMSGLLYYKCILLANTEVSLDMNADIKMARTNNTTTREDEITTMPIAYREVTYFNPQNGFASFLLPAVLVLLIQQTLLLGIGLSVGTTRYSSRTGQMIPNNPHYRGTFRTVLGKSLCYLMIYLVMTSYLFCVVPKFFSLVQLSNIKDLFFFSLPYILACIFFAMTISVVVYSREECMMYFVFTSVPLLFLSGISWPASAIPDFWRYVSYIFPSTFGVRGFVHLNTLGASLQEIAFEYKALWIQTGIYFVTAIVVYHGQVEIRLKEVKGIIDKTRAKRKILLHKDKE